VKEKEEENDGDDEVIIERQSSVMSMAAKG
jgi:hypothetical protein